MAEFWLPDVRVARKLSKDTDVLVLALVDTAAGPRIVGLPAEVDDAYKTAMGETVQQAALALGAKPELGHTVVLSAPGKLRIVVVGIEDIDDIDFSAQAATGAALRRVLGLKSRRSLRVGIAFAENYDVVTAVAEGALLGCYRYKPPADKPPIAEIRIIAPDVEDAALACDAAKIRAYGVCLARQWVNTPPNLLTPEIFAEEVAREAKARSVSFEIWDEERLEVEGFGGILAVGGGSDNPPRLVRLHYNPQPSLGLIDDAGTLSMRRTKADSTASFHLALVGKGITFDAGGLSLKSFENMSTMKYDMAGAAAVAAAVLTIADYAPNVEVTGWLALAENLPSGTAYRPSDVITMYNGVTVENANSDAEGRLVLADAISRAGEELPHLIVDIATLTGAARVALGDRTAALFSNAVTTSQLLDTAAFAAGEDVWQMPITEETKKKLESKVADLKSSGDRYGGAVTAAAFLREFVPEYTMWAHLDIAGPAFNRGEPYEHIPSDATGFGVLTLVNLALIIAAFDDDIFDGELYEADEDD
ncbi:MAG: leucyl aminopeptidase [Propionibacteriaceae bacterium]|jgi:leucyl aminopeptidase|nr:leucyl aminopeptidase [Propionibacteriaceae bacterium]